MIWIYSWSFDINFICILSCLSIAGDQISDLIIIPAEWRTESIFSQQRYRRFPPLRKGNNAAAHAYKYFAQRIKSKRGTKITWELLDITEYVQIPQIIRV